MKIFEFSKTEVGWKHGTGNEINKREAREKRLLALEITVVSRQLYIGKPRPQSSTLIHNVQVP